MLVVLTAVENGGAGRSKMVALGGVGLPGDDFGFRGGIEPPRRPRVHPITEHTSLAGLAAVGIGGRILTGATVAAHVHETVFREPLVKGDRVMHDVVPRGMRVIEQRLDVLRGGIAAVGNSPDP